MNPTAWLSNGYTPPRESLSLDLSYNWVGDLGVMALAALYHGVL